MVDGEIDEATVACLGGVSKGDAPECGIDRRALTRESRLILGEAKLGRQLIAILAGIGHPLGRFAPPNNAVVELEAPLKGIDSGREKDNAPAMKRQLLLGSFQALFERGALNLLDVEGAIPGESIHPGELIASRRIVDGWRGNGRQAP